MTVKEIRAKVLLGHAKQPDAWFGIKYTMNLYRGCQHQCIYCDSRSECYRIENFKDVLVKVNAIELLRKELASKRVKGTVGTGSMNDPYQPVEREFKMTRQALGVIVEFRFPVHIITKSDLVLRDMDLLGKINECYAAVSFSLSTADDALGKKVEPGAPLVSERLKAMKVVADHGIRTGITMMPILPFIGDNEENITDIVVKAREHGAMYILPWFGMSLRDRQRTYYYEKLDRLFPGLRTKYERKYGDQYRCEANSADGLAERFAELCARLGIATRMPQYDPETAQQLSLF